MKAVVLFLLQVAMVTASSSGPALTHIELKSSPATLKVPNTRNLTLRCNVEDLPPCVPVPQSDFGRTSLRLTNVKSIIITRGENDEKIAEVTARGGAKSLGAGEDKPTVTGDVSGTTGEHAFLELSWTAPTFEQADSYMCEVKGFVSIYRSAFLVTTLEVQNEDPLQQKLDELNEHVKKLDHRAKQQNQRIQRLEKSQAEEEKKQNQQIKTLKGEIRKRKIAHNEMGIVTSRYDSAKTWTLYPKSSRSSEHTVRFSKPYDEIPLVSVALISLDIKEGTTTRVNVRAANVDRRGFTVVFNTWANSHTYSSTAQWMSTNR